MEVITIESTAFKEIIDKIEILSKKENPKAPIYNNKEICKILHTSSRTLQKWRDTGLIGFSQIDGTILYSQNDIEQFLLKHHKEPFKQLKCKP